MKNAFLILSLSTLSLVAAAHAETPPPNGISIIKDMPEAAFAPPGFDSNDHSQVVLAGTFMNTCFKAGTATADVDAATKTIRVVQKAYYAEDAWCLQMLVPYTTTVDIGILPPGNYAVKLVGEQKQEKVMETLPIAQAKENIGPDDSLYGIADEVSYSKGLLTLKGRLPGSCARLKEVRVLTRKANIVEVLPIIETVSSSSGSLSCSDEFVSFEREVPVNLPAWKGRALVHVRSLNGQALNKVIELN